MVKIEGFQFGRITVDGQHYTQDLKVCRDRVIYPWWRRRGHRVEFEDVRDLVEAGPEIIVLGQGDPGNMKAAEGLKEYLQDRGISVYEIPTPEAVQEYFRLAGQGKEVCLGLHLTC